MQLTQLEAWRPNKLHCHFNSTLKKSTHLPLDKMAAILSDDIFKRIFLNENVRIFIKVSLKFVPKGPNWQLVSIGSGNGLAPNRQQAINRSNDGPVYRRIYAALGGDELSTYYGRRGDIKRDLGLNVTLWYLFVSTKISPVFVDIYRIPDKIWAPRTLLRPPTRGKWSSQCTSMAKELLYDFRIMKICPVVPKVCPGQI